MLFGIGEGYADSSFRFEGPPKANRPRGGAQKSKRHHW
jgi:hypothetical protein